LKRMRRSYKSRRSEIARIMGFDQIVREKVLWRYRELEPVDITIILCGDLLEKTSDTELFTIQELMDLSRLSITTIHSARKRLTKGIFLQCYGAFSKKYGSPKYYNLTGRGRLVVKYYNRVMLGILEGQVDTILDEKV